MHHIGPYIKWGHVSIGPCIKQVEVQKGSPCIKLGHTSNWTMHQIGLSGKGLCRMVTTHQMLTCITLVETSNRTTHHIGPCIKYASAKRLPYIKMGQRGQHIKLGHASKRLNWKKVSAHRK